MLWIEGEQFISKREVLLPIYRDKWRKIILSTEPINQQKATEAVKAAYECLGQKAPKILFYDNPYLCLKAIFTELKEQLGRCLGKKIIGEIDQNHLSYLAKFGRRDIWGEGDLLYWEIISQIEKELNTRFDYYSHNSPHHIEPIRPESWVSSAGWFDFEISVEQETLWRAEREMGLSLFKYCGWVLPFEKICLVSDRPCRLYLDEQQRLHAEGEPALQFADGYRIYSYHGTTIPEKYGKLHPHDWQAEWLIEETNAELRRVLIQGIGYARLIEELHAIEIDSYREYKLFEVVNNVDIETIFLLEMTCPSTGKIHILRVPPQLKSAREASEWINWGVDPERFVVQT